MVPPNHRTRQKVKHGGFYCQFIKRVIDMRLFISWSGDHSLEVGQLLNGWFPNVLQNVRPFMSTDIPKGANWFGSILEKLRQSQFGIVCLTSDNISSEWISFEAGTMAANLDKQRVTALLVDMASINPTLPLAHFQHTTPIRDDMFRLVHAVNSLSREQERLRDRALEMAFNKWWPDFENRFKQIHLKHSRMVKKGRKGPEADRIEQLLDISRETYTMVLRTNSVQSRLLQAEMAGFKFVDLEPFLQKLMPREAEMVRLFFAVGREYPLSESEIAANFWYHLKLS